MVMLETYKPSKQQQKQLKFLLDILTKCEQENIITWVLGGYGLDALYGRLTRDHKDFDLHIYKKDKEKFIEIIKSLGYCHTFEKVGEVGKEVYKHADLPNTFSIELGIIERGQELVRNLGFKLNIPQQPLGNLNGHSIWTQDLAGFRTIIDINNKLANKNSSYLHLQWQKEILGALETKNV